MPLGWWVGHGVIKMNVAVRSVYMSHMETWNTAD